MDRRRFFIDQNKSIKESFSVSKESNILDEAFDGIDLLMVDEIKEIIAELAEEKVILVSSHNTATLQNLCNKNVKNPNKNVL